MSSNKFVDDERFDGLYMNVAQTTRGIEPLLDSVFSFLRRKTDFFSGPPGSENGTEDALKKVNEVLKKHADLYNENQKKKISKSSTKTKKKVEKKEEVIEMGQDGGFDVSEEKKPNPAEQKGKKPSQINETRKDPDNNSESDNKGNSDDDHSPPPLGNGGTVEGKYVWTQTLSEVNINIPVPDSTRGKDLNVTIGKKSLKVRLQSSPSDYIVNAPLTKTIICDDSFWTVEDGNRLAINLQKSNQMEWWDSVCVGDPKIDVKTIQPESSSVSDLDGETRKTVVSAPSQVFLGI